MGLSAETCEGRETRVAQAAEWSVRSAAGRRHLSLVCVAFACVRASDGIGEKEELCSRASSYMRTHN